MDSPPPPANVVVVRKRMGSEGISSHAGSISKASAAFRFSEVAGGIFFIGGVVLALVGLFSVDSSYTPGGAYLLAMLPGIGVTVLGLIAVVLAQIGHASVVSAEIAAETLKIAKNEGKTSP